MKHLLQYVFASSLIIAIAVGLYVAKDWNSTTALFPRVIGFPMLALVIAVLAVDIKNRRRQEKDGGKNGDAEFLATAGRMGRYFGWLIGFVLLIWAIGIVYSIPIYIFIYLKIEAKYDWYKCGIYAAITTAFIATLFDYVFRVAWPEGALLRILNI